MKFILIVLLIISCSHQDQDNFRIPSNSNQTCNDLVTKILVKNDKSVKAKIPLTGIISSIDTPTHLIMNLGDYAEINTIKAVIQSLNPEVTPVIMVNINGKVSNNLIAYKNELINLNSKTEFIEVDISSAEIDPSYLPNWSRDFMPELITDGTSQYFLGFRYNRGDIYASVNQAAIARSFGLPLKKLNLFVEGGSYRLGPDGVLYISEQVVGQNSIENIEKLKLDLIANLDLTLPLVVRTKEEIEEFLKIEFKVQDIVWFQPPPKAVERTGHADMYFQFIKDSKKTVVVVEANYNARPEFYSTDFQSKVEQANLAFEKMAQIFLKRGFRVIRQKVESTETIFYSPTNSVYDGESYLTTNLDFRDTNNTMPFKSDTFYTKWNVAAKTIGSFGSLLKGGGIHCLTKQYQFMK